MSGRYLSFAEREDIALLRAQGLGVREIARRLGRTPSTISRELRRNASTADVAARVQGVDRAVARRALVPAGPKTAKLVANERLRDYVQDRLAGVSGTPDGAPVSGPPGPTWKGAEQAASRDRRWVQGWSPEQIARRLRGRLPR